PEGHRTDGEGSASQGPEALRRPDTGRRHGVTTASRRSPREERGAEMAPRTGRMGARTARRFARKGAAIASAAAVTGSMLLVGGASVAAAPAPELPDASAGSAAAI